MLHACDVSESCFEFIKGHVCPPKHLHDNIFARLSLSAMESMTEAEQQARQQLDELAVAVGTNGETLSKQDQKQKMDAIGDDLLAEYMRALNRPASILPKAMCALSSS